MMKVDALWNKTVGREMMKVDTRWNKTVGSYKFC